ncbi:hypothetical protein [Gracilibacillus lacisalsi]|nr:hypothetical protein [Gracilibacillus lacisalsi]
MNAEKDFYQEALIIAILEEERQEEYIAVFEENAQQVEERSIYFSVG